MRNLEKVLVTGAGGFIGSHLVESLSAETEVVAFVRYTSSGHAGFLDSAERAGGRSLYRGDLRDVDSVRKAAEGCDTIFHLASHISIPYSKVHPRDVFETNTSMTLNVLSAAADCDVERVVQISTSEVYGTAQTVPIAEEHRLHPQSVYAASKIACDQLALAWARQMDQGPEVVVLRPFNTYGPRQSARAVIAAIISQALAGNEIRLGNTRSTRDFLFVGDTARAMACAGKAERISGETVHVGSGVETSIADVVEQVGKILGKDLNIVVEDQRLRGKTEEVQRLLADPAKAKRLLGWKAETNLESGLEQTIEYFRNAPNLSSAEYRI